MTDLDFYLDALLSGQVLGVAVGVTADEVERALGDDFVDDVRKKRMRRDYGLVELYFHGVDGEWTCSGSTIQVHRLAETGADAVPATITGRYGEFRPVVRFAELADALRARADGRTPVRDALTDEFGHFHLPGTGSHLTAAREAGATDPVFGAVWSIELRAGAD